MVAKQQLTTIYAAIKILQDNLQPKSLLQDIVDKISGKFN